MVCPPTVGTYCIIGYLDGDPSYTFVMDIRWYDQKSPKAELTEFIIQQGPGVYIKIDKDNKIVSLTTSYIENEAEKDWIAKVGNNANIEVGNTAKVTAESEATIQAPQIKLVGNISSKGTGGSMVTAQEKSNKTHEGNYTLTGDLIVSGGIKGKVAGCKGCGG